MKNMQNNSVKNTEVYLANNQIYQEQKNFIILKDSLSYHKVFLKDILYCESDNSYITFFLTDGREILTTEFTMKECEKFLTHRMGFVRIHNRHIINVIKMNIFFPTSDGGTIQMFNGNILKVARARKKIFVNVFSKLAIN